MYITYKTNQGNIKKVEVEKISENFYKSLKKHKTAAGLKLNVRYKYDIYTDTVKAKHYGRMFSKVGYDLKEIESKEKKSTVEKQPSVNINIESDKEYETRKTKELEIELINTKIENQNLKAYLSALETNLEMIKQIEKNIKFILDNIK